MWDAQRQMERDAQVDWDAQCAALTATNEQHICLVDAHNALPRWHYDVTEGRSGRSSLVFMTVALAVTALMLLGVTGFITLIAADDAESAEGFYFAAAAGAGSIVTLLLAMIPSRRRPREIALTVPEPPRYALATSYLDGAIHAEVTRRVADEHDMTVVELSADTAQAAEQFAELGEAVLRVEDAAHARYIAALRAHGLLPHQQEQTVQRVLAARAAARAARVVELQATAQATRDTERERADERRSADAVRQVLEADHRARCHEHTQRRQLGV